ncbi:tRNA (cytosine(32)/uridine(32)-2'-O)-methyltransferase TrmJ [Shewanella sp. JNE10-2]|uniref:tRNA (cytosine(32)/uridine(32)-2'-O)-methyltransferase TrmJ n=1 Tax=unclassified Shewanella TaxID=196818 RepID=UPI00200424E5|nr:MULTISPECIES: tRNA (cytosine(32)/uridine(32)-2'-O)-methyltransferase TrmJ [unclassified Shewanella]MCK7629200.1 tRNA (cytosine(32)/uridine(32)-2'-O)-methyltransferase TrmJ [Shewanella sp. JNE9-1]MCK7634096.1 tRNA (cytosine(32)/uridine(32)-2'-O)-methyltransferase TrmJ [Shewanella sp. JNE17]MCK7644270.1 tRNA (cytosine(32)/uridine(32)-2'-O)-methyltransferase TrmJ [Shewanella sp. JNE3-1]MCK7649321.1 tRNA (cytosine(32)/uridine(32)-2'-O)-methyltransferase TrmJ [Shewanella sp. JNE8]MCK7652654.1 tR
MLSNIRVVLVGTSHPGNIGSTARAMKTMGLSTLYLAEPRVEPDGQSIALAAGASDILKHLVKVDSLAEAIADCSLVIATSARSRTLDWPMLEPREAGQKLVTESVTGPVAIVFGRENHGLSNEELQQCTYHVAIPANPEYSSLNLAQAVQIICYETRVAHLAGIESEQEPTEYPLAADQERFFVHLENTLFSTGFIIKNHPGQVMTKLRRLFSRARIESQEMNILRGILTSIDKVVSNKQK